MKIDLFYFSHGNKNLSYDWPLGSSKRIPFDPVDLNKLLEKWLSKTNSSHCLFWDTFFESPNLKKILRLTETVGDIFHTGLKMRTGGLPYLVNFVIPISMLNKDIKSTKNGISWRISLNACLIKTEVFQQMGLPDKHFNTIMASALDFGYRCITKGVIIRQVPKLVSNIPQNYFMNNKLTVYDELRFIRKNFGKRWSLWAIWRAALHGFSVFELIKEYKKLQNEKIFKCSNIYRSTTSHVIETKQKRDYKVTVLVPTLERYKYLRQLLSQIRKQTIKPLEIIIVDQSPRERRDKNLQDDFSDLPLRIIYLDKPGQCTSRNAGLKISKGAFILFLDDDDDELPVNLIEKHIGTLFKYKADVSSGVAHETGIETLPENFQYLRISDVFPTNNTMIRQSILKKSGLFDPAFDRGERADQDLGMRCYLAGALMVLNPEIRVKHLRAPRGGLREHGARKVTYAASRKEIWKRQIMSPTEIYLAEKYFTPLQVRESILQRTLGTFSIKGNTVKKLAKIGIAFLLLPHTLWKLRCNRMISRHLTQQIPM